MSERWEALVLREMRETQTKRALRDGSEVEQAQHRASRPRRKRGEGYKSEGRFLSRTPAHHRHHNAQTEVFRPRSPRRNRPRRRAW